MSMTESRTESVAVVGSTGHDVEGVLRFDAETGRLVREFEKSDWPEVLGVERLWRAWGPEDAYACYHAAQGLHPWPEKRLIWVAHPRELLVLYRWASDSGVPTVQYLGLREPTLFGLPVYRGSAPGLWLTVRYQDLWEAPR